MQFRIQTLALLIVSVVCCNAASTIMGRASDPQGKVISGARIRLQAESATTFKEVRTNVQGLFQFESLAPGKYTVYAESPGLAAVNRAVILAPGEAAVADLAFSQLEKRNQSVVITASTMEPSIDIPPPS